jgi:hypothetical protein
VDQDHKEATVGVDRAIKNPAKEDTISVDDKDTSQNIILEKNENDPSTTSASNTTSRQIKQPPHRTSKHSSATLKVQRR